MDNFPANTFVLYILDDLDIFAGLGILAGHNILVVCDRSGILLAAGILRAGMGVLVVGSFPVSCILAALDIPDGSCLVQRKV